MSILLPAIEKFIFSIMKIKIFMVSENSIICCILLSMELTSVVAELCYLLRYPARHGRKSGCQFSIRQMVIYQRFDRVTKKSRWIFVQAPNDFADELRSEFSSLEEQEKLSACNIHQRIFGVAEQEWRDYICYLEAELATLVRCDPLSQSHLFSLFFDRGLGRKSVFC